MKTTMRAASETLIGRKRVPAVLRGAAAIFSRVLWAKLHQERAAQLEGEVQRLRTRLATTEEEARCKADALQKVTQERQDLRSALERVTKALNEASAVLGAVCVASTLAPGESLKDPPRHAAVSATLSVIRERDIARSEADRLVRERDAARVERIEASKVADRLRQDLRAANTELARLRELTTPRRCGPIQPTKCLVYRVGMWLGAKRAQGLATTIAPNEWILPQPPPPPDEPWQEAEAEARKGQRKASGYVCAQCGKPCEIEIVGHWPRPHSRCCHMPARPAPAPGVDLPEVPPLPEGAKP